MARASDEDKVVRKCDNQTERRKYLSCTEIKIKLRCTLDALHLLDAAGRQLWSYAREATLKIKR